MRALLRAALIIAVLMWAPPRASASPGSFVYIATQCTTSQASCAPSVLVYDAATSALVAVIPIAPAGSIATLPSLAVSPDGSRVYASITIQQTSELIAIDATRHQAFTFAQTSAFPTKLAVSHDGKLLFVAATGGPASLFIYDTATGQLIKSIPGQFSVAALTADLSQDRVYWIEGGGCGEFAGFHAYDTALGSTVPDSINATVAPFLWSDLFASRDDSRLYLTSYGAACRVGSGDVRFADPASLTLIKDLGEPPLSSNVTLGPTVGTVEALSRNRVYISTEFGTVGVFDRDSFAPVAQVTISAVTPASFMSMAVTGDESRAFITSTNALNVLNLSTNAVDRTIPVPGQFGNVVATPPNPAASVCSYRVNTTQSSWTINGGTTAIGLKTNCAWSATSDSTWAHVALSTGSGDAALSLSVDPNFTTTNRTATLSIGGQVVTVTQASFSSTPAFGTMDTPADNTSGLSGAMSVTGWALDDVGVARVRIYRDPVTGEAAGQQVFIGNATFVDGARPDVQAVYPAFPNASRAGWGLQVLTNMLPNQGNGQFRLYAYADDVDGHTTLLGFKTVTIDNATSILPFGTIDTPGQGDTVSGVVVNFGWALSSALIPLDGSTIDVLIDGVASGHPVYNNFRPDIPALFPNLPNSNGAIGYFVLDTTRLSNGVHTIAWVVRDSNGAAAGIGSRFFTVAN